MSWTTAVADLRTLLSDGDTDRYAYRKKCFGDVDGINTSFKTFEPRRVINLAQSVNIAPLGVFISGVRVPYTSVSSDDVESGEFVLVTPPVEGNVVDATYYYRWFSDSELVTFLTAASEWLGLSTVYASIPEGLRPAAKYYAAQEAMHKMAAKWVERSSQQFQVEDAPDGKNQGIANSYRMLANDYKKKSEDLRDQYYTRQGQSLSPLFANSFGSVREITPRR